MNAFCKYLLAILLSVYFDLALCIIGRDLVLTPREGLQLTGKSIYYEEDSNEVLRNFSIHPWERTLKHVTFVTLFTNAAQSAIAGNLSKLKEYSDFLASPYISRPNANPIRFGDIVTLANGRLEQTNNHTYRFIEGACGYDCEPERVWAVWQVQKIRHRDQNQKFRYEMKFSVSPLRTELELNEPDRQQDSEEATHGGMYVRRNALKTYIQKEDDYPHSFGRIIYPEENAFAQRREDENIMSRNFRQATALTPIPQPTFIRGVFQAPPPGLPLPERLNIGEYIKNFGLTKATPKIEIYPNPYNLMNRNNYPTPTTFRPNYQLRLPKPDIYHTGPLTHRPEVARFPDNSNVGNKLNPPIVTHHFHHHFFMPGSGETSTDGNSAENHVSSAEQLRPPPVPTRFDKDVSNQVTPNYYGNNGYYEDQRQQTDIPPAPQKISFPLTSIAEHVVEITPAPPLKKPQLYPMYPINGATQIPLLIYPISTDELANEKRTTSKPFLQSEQISNTFRYSEPDPLYANNGQHASQVESPYFNNLRSTNTKDIQSLDSIEAQLPSPVRDEDVSAENTAEASSKEKTDLQLNHSQKTIKISTEKATDTTVRTESPQIVRAGSTTAATPITTDSSFSNGSSRYGTTQPPTTTETVFPKASVSSAQFISTSTTESPLRAVSRIRHTRPSTTTTEPAVLKWKAKRRNHHSNVKYNAAGVVKGDDSNAKGSVLHEQIAATASSTEHPITATLSPPQRDDEIFEVLTQKSVSRSVSIKVGSNGEEIPIIINDDIVDNEVKRD